MASGAIAPTLDLKNFRLTLECADCPLIVGLNENEWEKWLFGRSPERLTLLQWCLGFLKPCLWDRFGKCEGKELEKEVSTYAKKFGLSSEPSVILGQSSCEEQQKLWIRLTSLLKANCRIKQSSSEVVTSGFSKHVLSSLIRSEDFKNLLHTKVNLIPVALRTGVAIESKRELEEELKAALVTLTDLKGRTLKSNEECPVSIESLENYQAKSSHSFWKIQECLQHLEKVVFPVVKGLSKDPLEDLFGSSIVNLADNVIAFVQMLKDTENMKMTADALWNSQSSAVQSTDPSELQERISFCQSLVSEILSLMRMHNMM